MNPPPASAARQASRPRRKDVFAARRIRELRLARGMSPEALSYATAAVAPAHAASGRTIRRIEDTGMVPTPRVMFGIAAALGFDSPLDLWRLK